MQLVVTSEIRFCRKPDGSIWGLAGPYNFWARYLDVFDRVRVVARVLDQAEADPSAQRADGSGVEVYGIPYYVGPTEYILRLCALWRSLGKAMAQSDAVIFRIGLQLAPLMARKLWRTGHPYGVEVVGDPNGVFARGVIRHPLRPLMRWWFVREQRALCARACAASYVTERTLQRLYPTGGLEVAISDVLLPNVMEWAIPSAMNLRLREHSRRREVHEADTITVASIGSMDQLYKGFDVLIKAIALCQRDGLPLRLTLVGDGRYRSRLEELASRCGVAALVTFTGHVGSSEDVRRVLGSADLFVLASRTEGLPRVLLEAMALGLPCLGSEVGGIPELLPTECLVPRDDHITLAATLHALATNPAEQERLGKANIVTAARFCEDAIGPRRLEFYKAVRQATEKWNAQHAHP